MARWRSIADAASGPGWRFFWTKAVLSLGMLSGFLLSPRLWLSSSFRTYPLGPVSDLLPAIPLPVDIIWFVTLLLLLVAISLTPQSRWLVLLLIGLAGLLSLWDQSRWQPWFYMYLFMLGAFALRDESAAANVCRFIMAATYFWSGLQKCNLSFLTIVYPWFLGAFVGDGESAQSFATATGWAVPLLEMSMGIGLLLPSVRRFALIMVLAMHLALLLCLGPLGATGIAWSGRGTWP